ncbi:MAG: 4-carboxymuconolactone decarboxylase [Acetobacteraceae bacterium]|nr:4-carboxymuconolactone decarboxylase [Acetobacteraceae bacterium]MDW8398289.1 4-carboxymuconolactone decarboxylase [Acetobacteraceae bacterium]
MFVSIGGLPFHLRDEGPRHAPVVLMLHSLGTAFAVWEPQAAALARRFRVLRMDLRGHGLSGVSEDEGSMARFAADAFAALDALGIQAAHVAGLSIGGRIALEMAATAPDRVPSLMLCDTALEFPPPEGWQQRMEAVRAGGMAAIADAVLARWVRDASLPSSQGLLRMLLTTPPAGYASAAAALRDARAAPLLGRIACPTSVIVGEHDPATPPAWAEALRDAIPGATLTVIPGASHIPTFEAADALTAALSAHMARVLAPPADAYAAGMAVRKAVLGEAHVARAEAAKGPLDSAFQEWITRNVWGGIWTRPGLPRHTRSLITLAMMAALGRHEEFMLHLRATRNTGVTPEEIAEVLLQVGAYAGVPAANHALKLAKQTLKEMEEEGR